MSILGHDVTKTISLNVSPSELGCLAVLLEGDEVLACVIGHASEIAAIRALQRRWPDQTIAAVESDLPTSSACDELMDRLVRYSTGEDVGFSDVQVYTSDRTAFQRRVIHACQAIPRGETLAYGELARVAGSPRAARAVGSVMSNNCVPLIVPCHRVVQASGKLGGYSSPQGLAMKRRLLRLEKQG